ncbi:MAG: penicillin-binding protein 2 [Nitrospirae bacterium]|nr:penicillin-binding protein 2 [Nitrospirota bacterium]
MRSWRERSSRRFAVLTGILSLALAVIGGRVFMLAYLTDPEIANRARRQQGDVIELAPRRGKILDRNGTLLAISRQMASVYAHPRKVQNKVAAARRLSPFVGRSPEAVLRDLRQNKNFVWIARQVSPAVRDDLERRPIEGVGSFPEYKRFYPSGPMAAHALGFVGLDGKGLEGIELAYDTLLKGKSSTLVITRDGLGNMIFDGVSDEYESEGQGLVLTMDLNVQSLVDARLQEAVDSSGAKRGWAVAMDPQRGEILAWSTVPSFDPNAFRTLSPHQWKNHLVADAIDPGSTLKAIVMTAALETDAFNEKDTLYCENGEYKFYDRVIHDFHKYERLNFLEVFQLSSNICAAKIGVDLGRKTVYEFVKKFGLGDRTGIDLPGEIRGLISHYSSWTPVDVANISFGQGLAVTPIQIAGVFSAFANGGQLVTPHLAKKVTDAHDRLVREIDFPPGRRVASARTIERAVRILESVVTDKGTGRLGMVEGYRAAGKTGTAQKLDPVTKTYSKDAYVASFVGFAPADSPRVVLLVMLDEPRKIIYGGVVAAPVFRAIMTELLPYLGVYPNSADVRTS